MIPKLYKLILLVLVAACSVRGHYDGFDAGTDADAPPQQFGDSVADLVLGQPNFETSEENSGGISDRSLRYPQGIAAAGSSLWVVDAGNARVLRWDEVNYSFAPAGLIVGRQSFTDRSDFTGATASNLQGSCCGLDIAVNGNKLLVSDSLDNRVLVWNPTPTSNGQSANFVLGQLSPTCCSLPSSGNGAGQMKYPRGIWTDGTRVAVADTGNHRVLIWTTFPTTNGQPANVVLGQNGFGQSTVQDPPTASSMKGPSAVHFDGARFYVADDYNNRILVWSSYPTTNGQPADFVIGQTSFSSNGEGASRSQLLGPRGIVSLGSKLFVADHYNYRILVFDPIPTSTGASAVGILGQTDFDMSSMPTMPSQTNIKGPTGLTVVGNSLYVTDNYQHRVLRFDL
jgi:hypothetical protein